jgi:hypothetical protein
MHGLEGSFRAVGLLRASDCIDYEKKQINWHTDWRPFLFDKHPQKKDWAGCRPQAKIQRFRRQTGMKGTVLGVDQGDLERQGGGGRLGS